MKDKVDTLTAVQNGGFISSIISIGSSLGFLVDTYSNVQQFKTDGAQNSDFSYDFVLKVYWSCCGIVLLEVISTFITDYFTKKEIASNHLAFDDTRFFIIKWNIIVSNSLIELIHLGL